MALSGYFYRRDSKCSSSAFSDQHRIVQVAFYAIYFCAYLLLATVGAVRFFRSRRKGKALQRWWPLVFSITTAIM